MREIKFRAWIKTGNETDDYVKPMTIQQMIHSRKSTFSLAQLNNLVDFEQYTGVDDVSGKPIYEGDIVRADVSENTHFNYKVTFRNGEYIMVSPITNNTKLCSWYQSELNVIGNIHEDGDLIDH